jgi:HPt (histidine-containing phosphotransfer) domain-containing protein
LVGKLSTALRAAEHANARVIAHTLVGSPGLHGFDAALAICKEIESQAEGARADPAVLNAVEQLGTMFDSALVR